MRLTVDTAVSDRAVKPEALALEAWVNREARLVLAKLREAANFTGRERAEVVTAGAGDATPLWVSEALPQDCTWSVRAWVVGSPAAGIAGYGDFCQRATVTSRAGVVAATQFSDWSSTDVFIADPVFSVDLVARTVSLTVADDSTVWHFVAVVEVLEVLS